MSATASAQTKADPLTIYAAASLTEVFKAYDADQKYSFAGSNALETQIKNGAPADIFASAAPLNTQRLYTAGVVDKPVTFTANRLALIVPKSNPAGLKSVYDLKTKNVKLVIANAAVPVGGYTRTVLKKMSLSGVLSKVVSQEADVKGVTGKVALGQADAGFVYVTDARAVSDQVTVIRIPAWAQPRVRYEIAVVSKSANKAAAEAWIKGILSGKGQTALKNAGFLAASEGVLVDRVFRATLVLATGVALLFLLLPVAAIFLRIPPGELRGRADDGRRQGCARRDAPDERRRDVADHRLRHPDGVLGRHPQLAFSRRRRHAHRAAAGAAAGGRGDRSPRRVRAPRPARRDVRRARNRHRVHQGRSDPRRHVRRAARSTSERRCRPSRRSTRHSPPPRAPSVPGLLVSSSGSLLPLATSGLGAGAALAFARGIGEFGATIMFAGSLQSVTQTLSLAIYEQFDIDFDVALAISAVLVIISAVTLFLVKILTRWRSNSTSPIPFAASTRPSR